MTGSCTKVRPMFEQRVLAISEDVMFKWHLLVEQGRKAGHTFSQPDLISGNRRRLSITPTAAAKVDSFGCCNTHIGGCNAERKTTGGPFGTR